MIDEQGIYEYNIGVSNKIEIDFDRQGQEGCDCVVTTESITIRVPAGMKKYLADTNTETELTRNALLLYPYIANQKIGRAHV